MNLVPANRHLVVELVCDQKKTSAGVLLPEDYKSKSDKYSLADVIAVAQDSKFFQNLSAGDQVCIEATMVQEITLPEASFHLVLENYVIAFVKEFSQ